ncbi:MAG: hypothetical protein ACFFDH_05800 [Promethearchaeota archaeon]
MVKSPNLDKLKKLSNIDNPIKINQIFNDLINELKAYLNLEVVNNTVEISVVEEVNEKSDFDTSSCCYGVSRSIRDGIYYIKLFKNYKNLYPFLLLQSAYLTFVPNNLKETRFIDFAINQFVEIDLQEFTSVSEWSFFVREKYLNYNFILNQSDKFRFDRIFDLEETKASESPKQFFFEYIRRNSNENLDDNQHFILNKIYKEFIFKTSKKLQSNEITETLRILTKIFYKIKNCDTLE